MIRRLAHLLRDYYAADGPEAFPGPVPGVRAGVPLSTDDTILAG
jgi:hypothetical protein